MPKQLTSDSKSIPQSRLVRFWKEGILLPGILGSLLLFASFPPLDFGPLAWLATLPWLGLILRKKILSKRPYFKLWFAGFLFWFLLLHWLRLPHPATFLGWIALAIYLGFYLPTFVALGRVAVHRWNVPIACAAPIIWTGLELVRAHLLSGILMGSLAHTQLRWPVLVQIADIFGEYGPTFLVLFLPSAFLGVWNSFQESERKRMNIRVFFIALFALAATAGYGIWRLESTPAKPGPRIALIQGNSLAIWKQDPNRLQQIMTEYYRLSSEAIMAAKTTGQGKPIDLVVWPETMFRVGLRNLSKAYRNSPHIKKWEGREMESMEAGPNAIRDLAKFLNTSVLIGLDAADFDVDSADPSSQPREIIRQYNAAVLADAAGNILSRYDKVHLVMFGEYIPITHWFPSLLKYTPLVGNATPGEGPVGMSLNGIHYSPSICYETVLPHVIRRQVVELTEAGKRPDVLVNLTNDSWFWGSSELDLHLACSRMRAIELRTPMVIAANGGLTAHINSGGQLVQLSPRQKATFLIADVELDSRISFYSQWGDWFADCCLIFSIVLCLNSVWKRRANPQ